MIKHVTIRGFKSLVDVSVDLGPVTVLVGRSGTGKSNFVDAFRFLRDYLQFGEQIVSERGNWRQLAPMMQPESTMEFEVHFEAGGATDFRYRLVVERLHGTRTVVDESLEFGNVVLFEHRRGAWTTRPNVVNLPALDLNQPVIGSLPSPQEARLAFARLTRGIGCYEFSAAVLSPGAPGTPGNRTIEGLDDFGSNFLAVYTKIMNDLTSSIQSRRQMIAAMKRINASVESIESDAVQSASQLTVGHDIGGQGISLDISQESDGFRRFYAHLLALYQIPSKQTLLFEEPENGVYPGALAVLAEEFKAAPSEGRGQVILTTHSPGLLDHFGVDDIRVVEMEDYGTRISSVAQDQRAAVQESLLSSGELLTVDPARSDAFTAVEQP